MQIATRKIEQAVARGGEQGFEHLLKINLLWIDHGVVRLGFEVDCGVPLNRQDAWDQRRFPYRFSRSSD